MQMIHKQTLKIEKALESIGKQEKALDHKIKRIESQLKARELDEKVKAINEAITKTYLTLWFNTEGNPPTSIMMKLQEIGFKPSMGKHDFVYDWKQEIGLEDISKLGDTVQKKLKGSKVLYKLETF